MIAQTNLQLLPQLTRSAWSKSDVHMVANAYEAALDLFGGAVRSSGKPFLCHLVGTASVTARFSANPALAAAAVVHAAYESGDFGTTRLGRTPRHARRLRAMVGDEVEGYVAAYHELAVDERTVTDLRQRADDLTELERELVLLVLANETDDHLDGGIAVVAGRANWRIRPDGVAMIAALGRDAGLTDAADLLDATAAEGRRIASGLPARPGPKVSRWAKPRVRSLHRLPAAVAGRRRSDLDDLSTR